MNTTLSITANAQIFEQAQETAKKLDISFPELLTTMTESWLEEFVKKRTDLAINIRFIKKPSRSLIRSLEKAEKNKNEGKHSPVFSTAKEMNEWLESQGI